MEDQNRENFIIVVNLLKKCWSMQRNYMTDIGENSGEGMEKKIIMKNMYHVNIHLKIQPFIVDKSRY